MADEPKFQYVDRLEVSETFVDSLHGIAFDGQIFRFVFTTSRMDDPKPGQKAHSRRRYTACRLVMPPNAALELAQKINGMLQAMEKKGLIKKGTPPTKPTVPVN